MASVAGTRFAHTEGRVSLVYRWDGEKVFTLGMDGEMRVWAGIDDDDCENHLVGDEGFALAVSSNRIFTAGSGTNMVQAMTMEGDSDGVITKFTADATCLDTDESGALLAAGSADMTVKVTDTASYTDKVFRGHGGPILSLSLDPKKEFLATASCDGSVRIWNIATTCQVKQFEWLPKSNDITASSNVCGLRFSWRANWLAVPHAQEVSLLPRKSGWEPPRRLACTSLADKESFTTAAWRRDDSMLVAGTNKGNLCFWDVENGTVLHFLSSQRKFNICALAWNPQRDEVSFADSHGHWGLLEDVASSKPTPLAVDREEKSHQQQPTEELSQEEMGELFNDNYDDDEDDENSFSISRVQAEAGFAKDDDGNLILKGRGGGGGQPARPDSAASSSVTDLIAATERRYPPAVEPVRLQTAFQPGASPRHFTSRFLVYNSVGIVKAFTSSDGENNSIDVEFHDVAVHHAFHLSNSEGYQLAALTNRLLLLAREGDEETVAKISVNYFGSSDINKEWSLELAIGETILAVAAGDGWVALATSAHLRLLTAGGIQREVLSLAGPAVTLAGAADRLLVVIHAGHPLPDQQSMAYYIVQVSIRTPVVIKSGPCPLPLTRKAELYWAGLTDLGLVATADTAGMIRLLLPPSSGTAVAAWHPVCDTRTHLKGKTETFYIVNVEQADSSVVGIVCKTGKYPPTVPRPVPSTLPMKVPVVESGERGGLEQSLLSGRLVLAAPAAATAAMEEKVAELKQQEAECLMKLFALACRSDHESRAFEVCQLMGDVETIQLAIQYAAKIKRVGLAARLGELAMALQDAQDRQLDDLDDNVTDRMSTRAASRLESQDMFEAGQDDEEEASRAANPLLAARAKREQLGPRPAITSQRFEAARNPFARRSAGLQTASPASNSGGSMAFDTAAVPIRPSPLPGKTSLPSSASKLKAASKKALLIPKEKENKVENGQQQQAGGPLKGFALFMAEKRAEWSNQDEEAAQEAALAAWKALDKAEKEEYKLPRFPNVNKRKRSAGDEEEGNEQKKHVVASGSLASKLAGFACPSN